MRYIRAFLAMALIFTIAAGTINGTTTEIISTAINDSIRTEDSKHTESDYYDKKIALAESYLMSCQKGDGGFAANPESKSDIKDTSQAVIALASMGKNVSDLVKDGNDPLTYLLNKQEELDNLSNAEAQIGRYVVALASAGLDPRNANGTNYVSILKSFIKPDGEIGMENYVWDDAWVIMALASCNESQSSEVITAADHLKALQTEKGGWSWNGGPNGEDADTSSIALCALLGKGEEKDSDVIKNGLSYLHSEQNEDGGFSSLGSNAATDSWAILAIKAAGQNPAEWKVGSNDPIGHLLSLQKQNGSIWWKRDSEGLSFEWTADMIVALSGGEMPPAII
jgi:prenyltransferase beta subunit